MRNVSRIAPAPNPSPLQRVAGEALILGKIASILIAASFLATGVDAAEDQAEADEAYKKVYATRLFKRYGKGSDVLTKEALGQDWKRVARADKSNDGRIPFDEYLAGTKVPAIDWE